MAKVKLTSPDGNEFQLPSQCLFCASSDGLRPNLLPLYRSTPVQLLAILPFVMVGPALKTSGVEAFFFCFVLAGAALWAGQQKVVLRTYECSTCRRRRNGGVGLSVATLVVGLALAVVGAGARPGEGTGVALGVGLALACIAPCLLWLTTRRRSVRLVSYKAPEATIEVSDQLPLVWSAGPPRL